jgi:hypothetical protein
MKIGWLALLLVGCTTLPETARGYVADRAIRDLRCPRENLHISQDFSGVFKVFGCGRRTTYTVSCDGLKCVAFSGDEGLSPWKDRPNPDITRPP